MDFIDSWYWLDDHPIFRDTYGCSRFQECLWIDVVKVNPETLSIDDDERLNTRTRVWLESGPWLVADAQNEPSIVFDQAQHDYNLDVGGDTYEKAIKHLAEKVRELYGEYR